MAFAWTSVGILLWLTVRNTLPRNRIIWFFCSTCRCHTASKRGLSHFIGCCGVCQWCGSWQVLSSSIILGLVLVAIVAWCRWSFELEDKDVFNFRILLYSFSWGLTVIIHLSDSSWFISRLAAIFKLDIVINFILYYVIIYFFLKIILEARWARCATE